MHRYDKNSTINISYCHNNRVIELSINYFFIDRQMLHRVTVHETLTRPLF